MITGLTYVPNIFDDAQARHPMQHIDSQIWRSDFKRRVQHYGYIYDYKRRRVDMNMYIGELPSWSAELVDVLKHHTQFGMEADQMIINEYYPGQGISHHIDCEPCFGDSIASFSLGSHCVMSFIHTSTNDKVEILLEPNSLIIMSGEARYNWQHGIPSRKNDYFNGKKFIRNRRISLTFRKVLLS